MTQVNKPWSDILLEQLNAAHAKGNTTAAKERNYLWLKKEQSSEGRILHVHYSDDGKKPENGYEKITSRTEIAEIAYGILQKEQKTLSSEKAHTILDKVQEHQPKPKTLWKKIVFFLRSKFGAGSEYFIDQMEHLVHEIDGKRAPHKV